MASLAPILATESNAAKLLDMRIEEFRALVSGGHLPRGREIAPGVKRWDVETLRSIITGQAVESDMTW